MAIRLFQDTDFTSKRIRVTSDVGHLKNIRVGNNPSSMTMTAASDRILLFKKKNFRGGCLYRRGANSIPDLGDAKNLGKNGYRNGITSARLTPFTLRLNVVVIRLSDGTLPTGMTSGQVTSKVNNWVNRANWLLNAQQTLIRLQVSRIRLRADDKRFNMAKWRTYRFPGPWKTRGEVDLLITNSFKKTGTTGVAKFPCFGQTVTISTTLNAGLALSESMMGLTIVHELGHYLGLTHGTAKKDPENIMIATGNADDQGRPTDADGNLNFSSRFLRPDQIEEMHTRLSRNLGRRGDR